MNKKNIVSKRQLNTIVFDYAFIWSASLCVTVGVGNAETPEAGISTEHDATMQDLIVGKLRIRAIEWTIILV